MKKVFTTGQVAKICRVSSRVVGKWFDSGKLRGYRIPGHQDRRIPRDQLIRFLKEHGLPLGELEESQPGAGDPDGNDWLPGRPEATEDTPQPAMAVVLEETGPLEEPRDEYTTTEVARLCRVSQRTVSKWFDSGKLRGYRAQGTGGRRIPRDNLIRFLQENGMPLGSLSAFAPRGDIKEAEVKEKLAEHGLRRGMGLPANGPHPGATNHRQGAADATAGAPDGPEALGWLRDNPNPDSFPSGRFAAPDGTTREAARFVERLYSLGAERVVIPSWAIRYDSSPVPYELWAYASGVVVVLPAEGLQREALIWACAREMEWSRFDVWDEPEQYAGRRVVELVW
jgi:excisionase family DNA binding protein